MKRSPACFTTPSSRRPRGRKFPSRKFRTGWGKGTGKRKEPDSPGKFREGRPAQAPEPGSKEWTVDASSGCGPQTFADPVSPSGFSLLEWAGAPRLVRSGNPSFEIFPVLNSYPTEIIRKSSNIASRFETFRLRVLKPAEKRRRSRKNFPGSPAASRSGTSDDGKKYGKSRWSIPSPSLQTRNGNASRLFDLQNRAGHCGTKNLSSPAAQGRRPPGFFPGSPSGGFPRFPILKTSFSSSLRKKIGCKSEDFFFNL